MKATTVKVYKNARGNDLRNAHKINRLLSSFLSILGIHRNKIFAFHTSSSAYYLTRSPSSVECSRLNKMKKLIITKVEIDRPFLKLVCFVSSILTTCSKWEHKTHKLDLWEKSLCKRMLTWSYHYHFGHRRTGNFLPGGAVNHLPKKIFQVAQIFTKESKRNEGHITTT